MFGLGTVLGRRGQEAQDLAAEKARLFPEAVRLEPASSESTVVLEDPGKLRVVDGSDCAAAGGKSIDLEGSLELPDYATAATLFLRGWNLKYLEGDHHIQGLATYIYNIRIEENHTLKWNAVGALRDKNGDDGYEWCYYYTAIAWNDKAIDAVADHEDEGRFDGKSNAIRSGRAGDNETALVILPSYIQNRDAFRDKRAVVALPRGHVFSWYETGDHHLFQIAYNMGHSETFIERGKQYGKLGDPILPGPASHMDSGFVSWETHAIYKDNEAKRDYIFSENFSALGGDDVGVGQPPFSIHPTEDAGWLTGCITASSGLKTEAYAIENVPFDYAIPVLTGWELGYGCKDHHVREIGIRLHDTEYEKTPGASTGILRYKLSSILRDDSGHGHYFRHKVHILGLNASGPGTPPVDLL